MKSIMLYYTPRHASIEVENGASRKTTGPDMPTVLKSMPAEDLQVLVALCKAITNFVESGSNQFPVKR